MAANLPDVVKALSEPERRVLTALRGTDQSVPLAQVVERGGFRSEDEAYSAASWLRTKGLLEVDERPQTWIRVGKEGKRFLEKGFPERRVYELLSGRSQGATLSELRRHFGEDDLSIALAWWKRKGLGTIEKRDGDTLLKALPGVPAGEDERALQYLGGTSPSQRPEAEVGKQFPKGLALLRSRPEALEERVAKDRLLRLSSRGREAAASAGDVAAGLSELTPELLRSGAWKGRELRPYDLEAAVPRTFSGKPHPLVQLIEDVRGIFVELGFQEIEEDFVQSAFWNMDALFIPQDHPAREMQDTLYLQRPASLEVDSALIERISKVHESGGGTGSRGWGKPLDPKESRRALLRTHTTVGTIRYLAQHPGGPLRVFSIGRVFRKETMDATHLPEFHQIEGIATEPGADFPMLLGILQEFYRRLGFEKLRWRPAYFPYTEPSMEVEVWTGEKWMELGGCGIFRPEVTRPFGVKTPVLAWGLGLERLAMMRLNLKDIRDLYISDLEWLRSQPLL